jgi:tripartite-type tricarboxylate transporter receptor subunit TctC
MNRLLARPLALLLAAILAAAASPAVMAQPSKPIKFVVPFPAGGTADVLPRILAEKMRTAYPAGIVVENRSGAGGNIGADLVARSDPDGTTFLVSPPGPIAINQNLYKKLSFDPSKWEPVTVIATVPNVLDVRKDFPAKNLAEFIAYVKANPGKVTYASQGNGSTSHLTAHLFMQLTGTEMVHVPYKGTAPALVDVVGGQVDVFFDNLSSSLGYHKGGKLRILAVADQKRSPLLPDLPTFVESGLPGMVAVTFFAMVAPPGTRKDIVDATYKNFSAAIEQPDTRKKFSDQGATPAGWTPQQSAKFIQEETVKWGKVIKAANVTVE